MRIIGIDPVSDCWLRILHWLSVKMSVYCVYISEYNYYVLNHNIHIHSTVYHLTHGKPVLNDIPWYSQFQPPIGNTACNASALWFPSTWETDFRYADRKNGRRWEQSTGTYTNAGWCRRNDSGEILRPIHLSRPATLQRWSWYFPDQNRPMGYINTSWFS